MSLLLPSLRPLHRTATKRTVRLASVLAHNPTRTETQQQQQQQQQRPSEPPAVRRAIMATRCVYQHQGPRPRAPEILDRVQFILSNTTGSSGRMVDARLRAREQLTELGVVVENANNVMAALSRVARGHLKNSGNEKLLPAVISGEKEELKKVGGRGFVGYAVVFAVAMTSGLTGAYATSLLLGAAAA
ncbi:hypothetical protein GGI25_003991 [Coemansia spiralis]|uniref:Uncharacterized protein n=1 Tax=Coemansia spiralis TaxID=417178 RepID=A0A9W8KXL8_9FUNG|nr:hypothetical protein GGI25_003991 [Coemansia spiralis]